MGRAVQQLVESAGSTSPKLAVTREKADSITQVVTTTQVAGQTSLLSTNAAGEAEKAGEHGRVPLVAREARRLAGQAAATLGIESSVRLTQGAVSAGVLRTDKFGDEVRSGVDRVAEINGQTGQIIAEVAALSERFGSVNEGMHNQSAGAQVARQGRQDGGWAPGWPPPGPG
jgi:methyl-accepting chemotaxis protein WspA